MRKLLLILTTVVVSSISCKKEEDSGTTDLPTLSTLPIDSITISTASSGGMILDEGGASIIERGVVWSRAQSPTLRDQSTSDGTGTGSYFSNLTGLAESATYYVRAYASNSYGTAYGNEISFTTTGQPLVTISFGGHTYKTRVIGTQVWMAENLRTTTYANGDQIPNVTGNTWWNLTTGAWQHYNNDTLNDSTYGKLYNWHVVNDTRNCCPVGWHVPTYEEHTILIDNLGGSSQAGREMKSTLGWGQGSPPNGNNVSGFSGLPGGYREGWAVWEHIGSAGFWWTSSENSANSAHSIHISGFSNYVFRGAEYRVDGLSVRCLKD